MAITKWVIDAGHSQIQFKVKHLAIANVNGTFKTFQGSADSEDNNFGNTKVYFEIDAGSIDTNNSERDKHLQSDLFLNAAEFPKITFAGALLKQNGDYKLAGDLSILNTGRHVSFDVGYTGVGSGRNNDVRAGFEVSGKINRRDFGLNFHLLNDAGELVVGNEVRFHCDIELVKQ